MRNLIIDEEKLHLLLESKKLFIGGSLTGALGLIAGGVNAVHNGYEGTALHYGMILLGICMLVLGVREGWKNMKYNHEKMMKDIINLDQTAYHHSIVVFQDTFLPFANRYLVYWDKRWQCWFFLNYPTQQDERKNVEIIGDKISRALKIDSSCIRLERKCQKLQQKYSESHKEERYYDHVFYKGTITVFPELMKSDSFDIDGVSYRWMTMAAMKANPDIRKKNLDVVEVVEKDF